MLSLIVKNIKKKLKRKVRGNVIVHVVSNSLVVQIIDIFGHRWQYVVKDFNNLISVTENIVDDIVNEVFYLYVNDLLSRHIV